MSCSTIFTSRAAVASPLLIPWQRTHVTAHHSSYSPRAFAPSPAKRITPLPQVKNHFRVITPEEYDAAVQRDCMCSPLTATGDHRPGFRLLADAEADRQLTIADLAASRAGRALLDTIASAMEAIARSAEAGAPWH